MGRVRRAVGGGSAAALLLVAGCGQAADDRASDLEADRPADAARPRHLVEVVEGMSGQPYRFEMSIDVEWRGRGVEDVPLFSGEFDGERTRVLLDRGRTAEATDEDLGDLPPGVEPDDLVMEIITAPEAMYMRAPFLRAVPDEEPGDDVAPGYDRLIDALADGWVSVDLAELGGADPDLGTGVLAGEQSLDPSAYLDLVRSAGSVEEVGRDEIDGVPVTRMTADVGLVDLLRLRGIEPPTTTAEAAEALAEVTLPVEAWIDGRGRIRRVRVAFDMEVVTTALAEAGELPTRVADRVEGTTLTQTLDLRDHGDEAIEVDVSGDAVDVTEPFANLCRSAGSAAGPRLPTVPFPGGLPLPGELPSFEDLYADVLAEEAAMAAELDAMYEELGPMPEPPPPLPEIPPELLEPPPPPPEIPPELLQPPPPPPQIPVVPPELLVPPPPATLPPVSTTLP